MSKNTLVIGANGGIAKAIITRLCTQDKAGHHVYTVSRTAYDAPHANQHHTCLDANNDAEVKSYLTAQLDQGVRFDQVICATGLLHSDSLNGSSGTAVKPEKRLEDISSEQLAEYFRVNAILPALWLKYLAKSVVKERAVLVFFSARVGSISENELGGWYGYRASKAALNMLMKTASVEYKRRVPNAILACYHPGTVDTGLSKPFQANVKPGKLFTPEFTAEQLLTHIETFTPDQGPYYFDWDGKRIAY